MNANGLNTIEVDLMSHTHLLRVEEGLPPKQAHMPFTGRKQSEAKVTSSSSTRSMKEETDRDTDRLNSTHTSHQDTQPRRKAKNHQRRAERLRCHVVGALSGSLSHFISVVSVVRRSGSRELPL